MTENEAIIFPERGVVRVEACPVPTPGAAEVLIRTRTTLVSTGTELTALRADYPPGSVWETMFPFPVRPGYDNVGEVVALGESVEPVWLGRRVASLQPHARYVVAEASACRPVPDEVSDEAATFSTIAEIVMNGVRRSRFTWGEMVVVFGAGLLGQLTARVCLLAGAAAVLVVDVAPARLAYLPDDPRVHPVDARSGDVVELVRDVTRGRMADVTFEVTGEPELVAQGVAVLREQGRLVILSSPRGPSTIDLHDLCMRPSIAIIGAHNFSHPQVATLADPWVPARHAELFFELVRHGLLDVGRLISDRLTYRDAPALYERLQRDRSGVMGAVLGW
ncbi:MAG: zinc-binding dehydrogenase [Thioalkalivibrio sp.]|nr:zinc-binding dehydrogenase [Thioalkalivibrio sp.]